MPTAVETIPVITITATAHEPLLAPNKGPTPRKRNRRNMKGNRRERAAVPAMLIQLAMTHPTLTRVPWLMSKSITTLRVIASLEHARSSQLGLGPPAWQDIESI